MEHRSSRNGFGCQQEGTPLRRSQRISHPRGLRCLHSHRGECGIGVAAGHFSTFSAESPFRSKSRFYGEPNCYHQVAIYSATPLEPLEIAEPINGLLCKISGHARLHHLYGNVITIKDRWNHASSKNYQDRLSEQIAAVRDLPEEGCLVGGDFNTRLGWRQMQSAYRQVDELSVSRGWSWPTKMRRDTVQHVLHSSDLRTNVSVDLSVKEAQADRAVLSDHPFVSVTLVDGSLSPRMDTRSEESRQERSAG